MKRAISAFLLSITETQMASSIREEILINGILIDPTITEHYLKNK